MGWIESLQAAFRRPRGIDGSTNATANEDTVVGAKNENGESIYLTFNDRTITYTGDLTNYDYQSILRDKQANINRLYELADYFTDADPLFRGMIKGVYAPFAVAQGYRLTGANEQTKKK